MKLENLVRGTAVGAMLALLSACGGGTDGGGGGSCGANQTGVYPNCIDIAPAASVTAAFDGSLELHPSLDFDYGLAVVAPIRITESAGGTASWNFARITILRGGAEIERYELGADVIAAAGYGRIAARSNEVYGVVYRQNSDDFDEARITLGFSDQKDGRQFELSVPFAPTDIVISLEPLFAPEAGMVRPGR